MTTGLLFKYFAAFYLLNYQISTLGLRLEQTRYVLSLSSANSSVSTNQTQPSSSVCKCTLLKYCYLLPGQCEDCRKYLRTNGIQLYCSCLTSKDCLNDEYCDWDKFCKQKTKTINEEQSLLGKQDVRYYFKSPSEAGRGSTCTDIDDCFYGLYCINGTCTGKKKDGEHCLYDDDCVPDRVCRHSICTKNHAYSESCDTSVDCADTLFCARGICMRKVPFGGDCEWNEECEAAVENSECNLNTRSYRRQCKCWRGYMYIRSENECDQASPIPGRDPKAALEIYKVTMIFASCCLALILLVFLGCVIRKSYCDNSQPPVQSPDDGLPSLFTIWNESPNEGGPVFGSTSPPFEKPPSYEETIRSMREEIGIPPPIYDPRTFQPPTAPEVPMYNVNLDEPSTSQEDTRRFSGHSQSRQTTDSLHCDITSNPNPVAAAGANQRLGHTNQAYVHEN